MRFVRPFILFLAISTLGLGSEGSKAAEKPQEGSGVYDGELTIGLDPQTQIVTGLFESYTGWDEQAKAPRFSCIFYLYGKKEGDRYPIKTWFPGDKSSKEVIAGDLKWDEKGLFITLKEEHGGCWNVRPNWKEGQRFQLEAPGGWKTIRVVSAKKTYFYEKPDPASIQKKFLVEGDVVRVYEKKPQWILGEYQWKGRTDQEYEKAEKRKFPVTKGWVMAGDLFPSSPPLK